MMELPRACVMADEIVGTESVEFMSFGTNVSRIYVCNVLLFCGVSLSLSLSLSVSLVCRSLPESALLHDIGLRPVAEWGSISLLYSLKASQC